MEISTVKCGKNEDVIIEYHPENKTDRDVNITVDMLKTSPVGTKWQCHNDQIDEDTLDICLINIHTWEIAYRDNTQISAGVLVKHTKIVMKPACYTMSDMYIETCEYIWYEF